MTNRRVPRLPANSVQDGGFREVDVKVNRRGAVLRFALGYYARPQPEPMAPAELKALIVKSRVDSALALTSVSMDLPISVTALVLPRMGIQTETNIDLTIDASRLGLTNTGGVRTGRLELRVYCGDDKQIPIGEITERIELEASEATYAQWLQSGLHRVTRVRVTGTPKYVKVVVYDYGSDRVGSITLTLKGKRP